MIGLLHFLQRKLRPELDSRTSAMRYLLMSDVIGTLYSLPLILLGLGWLIYKTDWYELASHWMWLLVILAAVVIFSRLRFYMMRELRSGNSVGTDGDFVGVILWTSLLVFGPGIIWLFLIWVLVEFCMAWRRAINVDMRWDAVRSALLNAASLLIPVLLALIVYDNLDGTIPLVDLSLPHLLPALGAVLIYAVTYFLIWLPFILYVVWVQGTKFTMSGSRGLFWFSVVTMELPFISLPLGVLASGLYVSYGPVVLGIYFLSLLFIAFLANQLSRSAAQSRRNTIQLMGLEQLGRDILAAPTDARNLPGLLRKHLPNMFPCRKAVVWLEPETYLLKYPDGKDSYTPHIWPWLMERVEPIGFLESDELPWEKAPDRHFALLTAPILDPITGDTIGGLFIELLSLPQVWDKKTILEHNPALQNLAAQIAMALKQAENYQENMKHQRVTQELRLAGDIQSSFLPDRIPAMPGWDLSASLKPARQTSGDFYDFFLMDDGRLGILIADVADKGLGAALYMALGRTLLLTYAHEYPENPAAVLQATNQRMLSDARAQMFITAFYGVLEPENGRLIYCNAGHHPPLLIRNRNHDRFQKLNPNGMALGIDEKAAWVAISQRIEKDDTLLLYTDGVVEANNLTGEFYGMGRLAETTKQVSHRPSQWIIRAIQEDVVEFQDGVAQTDDITLICIRRRCC
jgi:serine phosphatase RsbU (regulator of sigma subunit)